MLTYADLVRTFGEQKALKTLESMERTILANNVTEWTERKKLSLEDRMRIAMNILTSPEFAAA